MASYQPLSEWINSSSDASETTSLSSPHQEWLRTSPPLTEEFLFKEGNQYILHHLQILLLLKHNLGGADISQEPQGFFIQRLSRACPRLEVYMPPGTL